MNPVTYAQELVKHQGWEKALEIANGTVRTSMTTQGSVGCPFTEEVEIVVREVKVEGKIKQVETTVIDEAAQAKRLAKTLTFWKNVAAYLNKRKPVKKAA